MPDEELIAFGKLSEFTLPDGDVLVRNPRNDRKMVLPADVMNALTFCTSFRTLDEHAEQLAGDGGTLAQGDKSISSIIQSVHAGGLAISTRDICSRLEPAAPRRTAPQNPVAVIITCDRPPALERLIQSILSQCSPNSYQDFHVINDSRSPESRNRNQEISQRNSSQQGIDIRYFGAREARNLVSRLIEKLPEHEGAIRFLLDQGRWSGYFSPGLARNFSHLISIGRPVIVFDDDAICSLHESPFRQNGCEFSDGRKQALFFENHEQQEHLKPAGNIDPIQQHLRYLGLTIPEALHTMGLNELHQDAFRLTKPDFAVRLNRQSRIRVSEFGSWGNPGTADYKWLGTLPPRSLARLLSQEDQQRLALNQSQCWMGVDRPTFTPAAHISQVTGFDNSDFLPPYFPIDRGEDHIFGEATRFIYPESVCLIQPKAVLHLRLNPGSTPGTTHARHNPDGFPGRLTSLPMGTHEHCNATSIEKRLSFLARSFSDLASSPAESILSLYSDVSLVQESNYLKGLRETLNKSSGADPAWIGYLHDSIRQSAERMKSSRMTPNIPESAGQPGVDKLISFWQDCWGEFAQALLAWPVIRREAGSVIMDVYRKGD
jgi:hypothetical protein